MTKQQKESLRNKPGIAMCASIWLMRAEKIAVPRKRREDPANVDQAVREGFGGNWEEFEQWATDYLSNAVG